MLPCPNPKCKSSDPKRHCDNKACAWLKCGSCQTRYEAGGNAFNMRKDQEWHSSQQSAG